MSSKGNGSGPETHENPLSSEDGPSDSGAKALKEAVTEEAKATVEVAKVNGETETKVAEIQADVAKHGIDKAAEQASEQTSANNATDAFTKGLSECQSQIASQREELASLKQQNTEVLLTLDKLTKQGLSLQNSQQGGVEADSQGTVPKQPQRPKRKHKWI